jgi:diguanylate cyclase (GGDEF)-like protein
MTPGGQALIPAIAVAIIAGVAASVPVAMMHAGITAVICAALAVSLGAGVLSYRPGRRDHTRTGRLAQSPMLLERRRRELQEELVQLAERQELQRGVFEVSAELVGCIEEADARARFSAALRRYWSYASVDLLLWEKGECRSLGGSASGEPPLVTTLVALPEENHGDLVLDLSPEVDKKTALVLRGARSQPSLRTSRDEQQRYVADVLRSQLALSLRRVLLYGDLQALARTDPLTGCHRRWYGETRLKDFIESGEVLSVAMVDIDLFKNVNDRFGHAAGDQVLAAVGHALVAGLRSGDLVSRQGGEEFLVLLPETPPPGALLVAERLRAAIAALTLVMPVTISVGVACCLQDETAEELVARADEALYFGKRNGRNRVVMASEPEGSLLRTTSKRSRVTTALVRKPGR